MTRSHKKPEITTKGKVALTIGTLSILFPAMSLIGFLEPEHTLPTSTLVAIAVIGSAVAGVVAFPRQWLRSSIAGAVTGGCSLMGILLYVIIRTVIIESDTFYHFEFVLAGLIGGLPGAALFRWVRSGNKSLRQAQ
ncbi:MAG: hypothetical protein AAFS04_19070 [Cyanobacteria bacterium J06631_9]